ncbi:hypothetical protein AAHZ94_15615 [Streptomyces sp. HSW2009]
MFTRERFAPRSGMPPVHPDPLDPTPYATLDAAPYATAHSAPAGVAA